MWLFVDPKKTRLARPEEAPPGRSEPMPISSPHHVLGTPLRPPFPTGHELALFGLGCFWGVEKLFWSLPGVFSTSVGYAGGFTPHATYREVCSGLTGHNEVVRVVFDPSRISYRELLRVFFESHDPTQGMRQGNDVGTQYRSGIYSSDQAQREAALELKQAFGRALGQAGFGPVTTEIEPAPELYYAEEYHQQYLSKNPDGYCGLGGTGVSCPVGTGISTT